MAIKAEQLFKTGGSFTGPFGINDTFALPLVFSTAAAVATLAKGTPVAKLTATNKWVVWENGGAGGANVIQGFTKEEVTVDTVDDVIGVVMLEGVIDYKSIALPAGELEADLKAALRANNTDGVNGLRALGIKVTGLDYWA